MKAVYLALIIFISIFTIGQVRAERSPWTEDYYNRAWCSEKGGIPEYRLTDGKRVDCLTKNVAYEADWGKKWAESIGQSLAYGMATKRRSGILLLIRNEKDLKNLEFIRDINRFHNLNIDIRWIITKERDKY